MNMERLRQFLVLSDTLNLTRASELLYISQPALSQSIDALEKELNCKLFDRTKKKFSLNQNGLTARKYVSDILRKYDEMLLSLSRDQQAAPPLNIGSSMYALYVLLSSTYAAGNPPYRTVYQKCSDERAKRLLRSGEIDLALTESEFPEPEFYSELLFTDEQYFLVPANSPWYGASSASFSDMRGERFYRNKDVLTNSSMFFSDGNGRHFTSQFQKYQIQVDYLDLVEFRMRLADTTDHMVVTSTLGTLVTSEMTYLDRKRYVHVDTPWSDKKYYLVSLKEQKKNVSDLFRWFHAPDNLLRRRTSSLNEALRS